MNAKQVAELSGVSVRTLHHYDEIGLLSPGRNPANGYRSYADEDLDRLQQILFFRRCGFPLERIGQLLSDPEYDRDAAYAVQEKYLLHEKNRINTMLDTLRKSYRASKGEILMSNQEKFHGFDMSSNPYEDEARARWGDKAVDQSNAHIATLGKEGQKVLGEKMNALFRSLAEVREENPESSRAQQAISEMYGIFNSNIGHHYTPEAFEGLGQMYITDSRFTENIDQFGDGLAQFLAEAMRVFARNQKK